ncbi:MAG: DUF4197 family protein, partial [Candidatus Binataceae bacterium]
MKAFPMSLAFPIACVLLLSAAPFASSEVASDRAGFREVAFLDPGQAAAGLKEALGTGTVNAVKLIGRPNGYLQNAAIKILLPQKLRPLETGLRAIGYGPKIDQFVVSMNRAAEA